MNLSSRGRLTVLRQGALLGPGKGIKTPLHVGRHGKLTSFPGKSFCPFPWVAKFIFFQRLEPASD